MSIPDPYQLDAVEEAEAADYYEWRSLFDPDVLNRQTPLERARRAISVGDRFGRRVPHVPADEILRELVAWLDAGQ